MTYIDPPQRRSWRWHLQELGSWLSCGLNVMTGGERDMTFSAASWYLHAHGKTPGDRRRGSWRVAWVDALNRIVTGERDHCRAAFKAVQLNILSRADELRSALTDSQP